MQENNKQSLEPVNNAFLDIICLNQLPPLIIVYNVLQMLNALDLLSSRQNLEVLESLLTQKRHFIVEIQKHAWEEITKTC